MGVLAALADAPSGYWTATILLVICACVAAIVTFLTRKRPDAYAMAAPTIAALCVALAIAAPVYGAKGVQNAREHHEAIAEVRATCPAAAARAFARYADTHLHHAVQDRRRALVRACAP